MSTLIENKMARRITDEEKLKRIKNLLKDVFLSVRGKLPFSFFELQVEHLIFWSNGANSVSSILIKKLRVLKGKKGGIHSFTNNWKNNWKDKSIDHLADRVFLQMKRWKGRDGIQPEKVKRAAKEHKFYNSREFKQMVLLQVGKALRKLGGQLVKEFKSIKPTSK